MKNVRRSLSVTVVAAAMVACGGAVVETTTTEVVMVQPTGGPVAEPGAARLGTLPVEHDAGGETPCAAPLPGQPTAKMPPPVEIDAGDRRSCSRHADGRVCCWGQSLASRWSKDVDRVRPVLIQGIDQAAGLALGTEHSCVRTAEGGALCWGRNRQGQLGNGNEDDQGVPLPVVGLEGVESLASGRARSCAVLEDGTVRCWGHKLAPVPRRVDRLEGVAEVTLADNSACALLRDGSFRCFDAPQLFIYRHAERDEKGFDTLRSLTGLSDFVLFSRSDACAVGDGGRLLCLGRAYGEGKVIDRMSGEKRMVATRFSNLEGVEQLVSSGRHHCARMAAGTVWCWGQNGHGQLGDGTAVDRSTPVQVVDLFDVVDVAVGPLHSCALRRDGEVLCWGENRHGQLGDGTAVDNPTPVFVRW